MFGIHTQIFASIPPLHVDNHYLHYGKFVDWYYSAVTVHHWFEKHIYCEIPLKHNFRSPTQKQLIDSLSLFVQSLNIVEQNG